MIFTPETTDELTETDTGVWLVTTKTAQQIWDLDDMWFTRLSSPVSTPMLGDDERQPIYKIGALPKVGRGSLVWFDDPVDPFGTAQYRVSSFARRIMRLPDLSAVEQRFAAGESQAIDIQRGWHPLLAHLDAELAKADPTLEYAQIKEKWGSLRVYTYGGNDKTEALIREAERLSWRTCERCGDAGTLHQSPTRYQRTLCSLCAVVLNHGEVER